MIATAHWAWRYQGGAVICLPRRRTQCLHGTCSGSRVTTRGPSDVVLFSHRQLSGPSAPERSTCSAEAVSRLQHTLGPAKGRESLRATSDLVAGRGPFHPGKNTITDEITSQALLVVLSHTLPSLTCSQSLHFHDIYFQLRNTTEYPGLNNTLSSSCDLPTVLPPPLPIFYLCGYP
jgi:hypothetical protein